MTNNIINFSNRQLCEYNSIFPNVASLLDHLLFTIGNGYGFDYEKGMPVYSGKKTIDQFPKTTAKSWSKLLEECYEKEKRWHKQLPQQLQTQERLDAACAKYKIVSVCDEDFKESALLADITGTAMSNSRVEYYRPYPFSENYSAIYKLNENTPTWFVLIALDFCSAWITFLNSEIASNHVSTKADSDYADLEWTTTHRDELVKLVAKLSGFIYE